MQHQMLKNIESQMFFQGEIFLHRSLMQGDQMIHELLLDSDIYSFDPPII
jgi:hypothetical protein